MAEVAFFDLDGTLADTDRDIREAWKAALADLGLECPRFDELFVAGPPIDDMARTLFPDRFTSALVDSIRARFAAHYDNDGFPNTREYPGVLEAVRELKRRGIRPFIATNKRYRGAVKMAEKFGWNEVFEELYAGDRYRDDPAIGKMKKGALLAFAMDRIGVAATDCLMVGDTVNDFEAARQNGIRSVGVAWGYGKSGELALADRTVDEAAALVPLVCGWSARS